MRRTRSKMSLVSDETVFPFYAACVASGCDVFFSSRRRHTIFDCDWSSDVCSSDLFIDVKDATGTITNWAVEFGNPLELEKDGWKRSALHIGDVVTVEAILARTESRRAQIGRASCRERV